MRVNPLRALPLLLVAGALPIAAQTTGALQGRVKSSQGASVGGAKVTLSGATLQGTRMVLTEADGSFRIGLLPPGAYTLTLTKEGMNTTKVSAQVGLDKTATLEVTMASVAAAVVEVTDTATAVDVKATTVGANFTTETIQQLPLSRDFGSIALLAPGVTEDREGLKVYGASGAENNYVVDGINTTNVEFGTQGKKIPMEFIQEFQVKTGGYEPEYGKALGGVLNVITKSGGNEFSGDVFAYEQGYTLKTHNSHQNQGVRPVALEDKTMEIGFDVGGAIIKDRLWFFVAYDRSKNDLTNQILLGSTAGQTAPTNSTRDLFAGKLTWKLSENQNLIFSVLGDPEKVTGAVKTPEGPSSTWDGEHKVGGTDLSLRYEISGPNWFAQVQASQHEEKNSTLAGGAGGGIQLIDNRGSAGGAASGGFGRYDDKDFTRNNITGSFTYFIGSTHELKAGFDFQTDKADIHRGYTGNQQVTVYDNPLGAGNPDIYSHYYWTSGDAYIDNTTPANSYVPSIVFASKPKHESQAYFLQDKISLPGFITVNLGVRLDQTDVKDQFGASVIKLKDQWSPRLGFVWDFKGKGQDKVFGSFSRYYEQVPLDLVIRSFSIERNPTIINYSPTSMVIDTNAETDYAFDTSLRIVGTSAEPVDKDLKGSYSDEIIVGAETTFDKYTFGAKYIRRYLGRAIEDGLDTNQGNYFIMNPGISHDAGVTFPKAVRDYTGVELTAQRRFANHYTWQLSYLWSHLRGNYEGAFQGIGGADGSGQLDPNINAAYDLQEFIVNSGGDLSGDRRHQFKANGYYEWDFGLSVGATFQYQTGTPISRLGYHNGYGRYELFLLPRGTDGRTPDTNQLDVNVAYSLKLGGKQRLRFMADITNLLNSQATTISDQRYNFDENDIGQTNSNYKGPFAFQAPRAVRLGVRYSF